MTLYEEAFKCPADVDKNDLVARFLTDTNEQWQCPLNAVERGAWSTTTKLTEEVEKLTVWRTILANFVVRV
jgi:hypothetical protein